MLFKEPIQIKKINLRNRIVLPPMATAKALDGAPGSDMIKYYRERARGTALIILEHEYVALQGKASASQLSMADDAVIPAYRKLCAEVHEEGAKLIAQINHAGAKAADEGIRHVAPSAVAFRTEIVPEELNKEEIQNIIKTFTDAAVRTKKSGFDGVEIHAAHGYLLNQFYSPITNRREDEYSVKTMENRTRIHSEVIQAVRKAVGDDYVVAIRFGACDFVEGGSEIADIAGAVKAFEEAGADIIDISGGVNGYIREGYSEPGYLKDLGRAAKSSATVPVILTGGIKTARDVENLLKEGACDLVGVGRAFLNDGEWAVKALGA